MQHHSKVMPVAKPFHALLLCFFLAGSFLAKYQSPLCMPEGERKGKVPNRAWIAADSKHTYRHIQTHRYIHVEVCVNISVKMPVSMCVYMMEVLKTLELWL